MAIQRGKSKHTDSEKQATIARMDAGEETIKSIAEDVGVSPATLHNWRRIIHDGEVKPPKNRITSEDCFGHALQAYTMTEQRLNEYCVEQGLDIEEVRVWLNRCKQANRESTHYDDPGKTIRTALQQIETERKEDEKILASMRGYLDKRLS